MAASDLEPTAAQSGNSPNSKEKSVEPKKDETVSEAMNHFNAGKRHMLVQDIPSAVESLALACELFSEQYGETAGECAETYLYYGKALLEMARLESGVLGNALDGVPEEEGEESDSSQIEDPEKMTADEKEEVGVKVTEALDENFTKHEETIAKLTNGHAKTRPDEGSTESEESQDEEEESPEEGEQSQDDDKDAEKEKTGDEEKKETENKEDAEKDEDKKDTESVGGDEGGDVKEQEAEDDEDPSNLQLAWEMLELAKVIFTRKCEEAKEDASLLTEMENKLCETYLTLGEVSLENENYTQAVEDLSACLKKREEKLPEDSRSIAETHYQLGVALGFQCSFEEAVKALNDAIKVLTKRIENLKAGTESKDTSRTDDAFYTKEREIAELEKLLPEIQEKIQDTDSMKKETIRKMKEEVGFSNGAGSSGEPAKPVSTIAVKKRKVADDEPETSPKKAHLTNGSS